MRCGRGGSGGVAGRPERGRPGPGGGRSRPGGALTSMRLRRPCMLRTSSSAWTRTPWRSAETSSRERPVLICGGGLGSGGAPAGVARAPPGAGEGAGSGVPPGREDWGERRALARAAGSPSWPAALCGRGAGAGCRARPAEGTPPRGRGCWAGGPSPGGPLRRSTARHWTRQIGWRGKGFRRRSRKAWVPRRRRGAKESPVQEGVEGPLHGNGSWRLSIDRSGCC